MSKIHFLNVPLYRCFASFWISIHALIDQCGCVRHPANIVRPAVCRFRLAFSPSVSRSNFVASFFGNEFFSWRDDATSMDLLSHQTRTISHTSEQTSDTWKQSYSSFFLSFIIPSLLRIRLFPIMMRTYSIHLSGLWAMLHGWITLSMRSFQVYVDGTLSTFFISLDSVIPTRIP